MRVRKFLALVVIALLVGVTTAMAQGSDPVSGKYEGVAKSDAMGDLPITVNLKNTNGKLSGSIETGQGSAAITDGTYADGKLKLKFDAGGTEGTVEAEFKDGVIKGKWELGGMGGPLEIKKAGASTPAAASSAPAAGGAAMMVGGEWAGSADVMGQAMPFTLKLKQEGDKLTGTSESDQGSTAINAGKVAGDKISFKIDGGQGEIVLTGTVSKDGKTIDGEYDFAGQMKGKWSAKKKN
jgi:hypothetical protein